MKLQKQNLGKVAITIAKDYYSENTNYDKLTIVQVKDSFATYISRKPIPTGVDLNNREYWIPFSSLKEDIVIDYNSFKEKYGEEITSIKADLARLDVPAVIEEMNRVVGSQLGSIEFSIDRNDTGNRLILDLRKQNGEVVSSPLPQVSSSHDGLMTSEQANKLDEVYDNKVDGIVVTATNIGARIDLTSGSDVINSSAIHTVNSTKAGLLKPTDYTKYNNFVNSKGNANGLATLDESGHVPASQLPSYVDDIVEYNGLKNFPIVGESGKLYVAREDNLVYRWSGSEYVVIPTGLALGETPSTAFAGDKGKLAYDTTVNILNEFKNPQTTTVNKAILCTTDDGYIPVRTNQYGGIEIELQRIGFDDNGEISKNQLFVYIPKANNATNGVITSTQYSKIESLPTISSKGTEKLKLLLDNDVLIAPDGGFKFKNVGGSPYLSMVYATVDFNSTGNLTTINKSFQFPDASTTVSGMMSAQDKAKVDMLPAVGSFGEANIKMIGKHGVIGRTINTSPYPPDTTRLALVVQSVNTSTLQAGETYIPIPNATANSAGMMSATDKQKLDSIDSDNIGGGNGGSSVDFNGRLLVFAKPTSHLIKAEFSDLAANIIYPTFDPATGINSTITFGLPAATSESYGIMSRSDKVNLDTLANRHIISYFGFGYDLDNNVVLTAKYTTATDSTEKVFASSIIPTATITNPGLLSANDKRFIDSLADKNVLSGVRVDRNSEDALVLQTTVISETGSSSIVETPLEFKTSDLRIGEIENLGPGSLGNNIDITKDMKLNDFIDHLLIHIGELKHRIEILENK